MYAGRSSLAPMGSAAHRVPPNTPDQLFDGAYRRWDRLGNEPDHEGRVRETFKDWIEHLIKTHYRDRPTLACTVRSTMNAAVDLAIRECYELDDLKKHIRSELRNSGVTPPF
jgi:alkylhydroperoxidase/carboxymuconolactone decarboxylase family protein YurZ